MRNFCFFSNIKKLAGNLPQYFKGGMYLWLIATITDHVLVHMTVQGMESAVNA